MCWIVSSNMNTFMHEKAQFASTLKGISVYLACIPADITLLHSRGMGFIQSLYRKAFGLLAQLQKATSSAAFGTHFGFWTHNIILDHTR